MRGNEVGVGRGRNILVTETRCPNTNAPRVVAPMRMRDVCMIKKAASATVSEKLSVNAI